jgi:putative transposase
MSLYSQEFRITKMARVFKVSPSGYHAWKKRGENKWKREDKILLEIIKAAFAKSRGVYGSRKIKRELKRKHGLTVSRSRVARLMNQGSLVSRVRKKYKATTNSKHNLPVAENILNRDFIANQPKQKLVSDITYIPTDEGWLYLACMMDLYGSKIVGMAMSGRMTKELVIEALKDAVNRCGRSNGGVAHSDYAEEKAMPKNHYESEYRCIA